VADEKKQIPKHHERLEVAVKNLHAAINDLTETLAPLMYAPPVPTVTGPAAPMMAEKEAVEPAEIIPLVPYAKALCDRCESVEAATASIRGIKRRLQV